MKRSLSFSSLLLWGLLAAPLPALADAVTDWNDIAATSVAAGRPGPIGLVDLALVQIAVHDAVQALEGRFEPYHAEVKGAHGRRAAAVAAAAHGVLVGMYSATQGATLDATYFAYLADKGLTGDPGLEVGEQVAALILPLRRVNPVPLPPAFTGGTNPGQWRPTPSFLGSPPAPPPFSAMATPWLADFDGFTLTAPWRFRPEPPPAMTSERYRRDFEEVKALGSLTSTARTAAQTDLAHFWTDNFPVQWNRALRAIASAHVHRTGDTARLFALANLAMADSIITSWDSKRFYNFWRPITAIREAADDGNPHTLPDPDWQSLINNPNYPDYTSGANSVTGSVTRILQLFFGTDRMTFDLTSNAPLAVQKTRTFHRFSQAAQEVVDARVYLGIHFRFADTAGRASSRRVAEHVFHHYLLDCREGSDHH